MSQTLFQNEIRNLNTLGSWKHGTSEAQRLYQLEVLFFLASLAAVYEIPPRPRSAVRFYAMDTQLLKESSCKKTHENKHPQQR